MRAARGRATSPQQRLSPPKLKPRARTADRARARRSRVGRYTGALAGTDGDTMLWYAHGSRRRVIFRGEFLTLLLLDQSGNNDVTMSYIRDELRQALSLLVSAFAIGIEICKGSFAQQSRTKVDTPEVNPRSGVQAMVSGILRLRAAGDHARPGCAER